MLTTAMTAPTPMMMPSIVNAERILFRASARSASRNVFMKSISYLEATRRLLGCVCRRQFFLAGRIFRIPGGLFLRRRKRFQDFFCNQPILDQNITPQLAVSKLDIAFCVLGN